MTHVRAGRAWSVGLGDGTELHADGVVLAADTAGLQRIVESSPASGTTTGARAWRSSAQRHRSSCTGCGSAEEWIQTERHSSEQVACRRWTMSACWTIRARGGDWSRKQRRFGGRTALVRRHEARRRRSARSRSRPPHELYPEDRAARRSSTSSCCAATIARGSRRAISPTDPRWATPDDGLVLAGDGIRIDLPVALMERAATTGWSAANRLLEGFGIRGHTLKTVPNRGRMALLSRLAEREARTG